MDPKTILDNYTRVLTQHYFDMNGRVGRAEFWYFMLAVFVFAVIAALLESLTFLPVRSLYDLAMLLPVAGMGARRLQDTGHDGRLVWVFLLFAFVSEVISVILAIATFGLGFLSFLLFGPLLGLIHLALLVASLAMLWFWCQPGDPAPTAYGPPPPVFDPAPLKPA